MLSSEDKDPWIYCGEHIAINISECKGCRGSMCGSDCPCSKCGKEERGPVHPFILEKMKSLKVSCKICEKQMTYDEAIAHLQACKEA
jgi:hypothetical protein